ncbi:hypothetical protein ACKFKG_08740 [Phormidesmis sp. 146-35]
MFPFPVAVLVVGFVVASGFATIRYLFPQGAERKEAEVRDEMSVGRPERSHSIR